MRGVGELAWIALSSGKSGTVGGVFEFGAGKGLPGKKRSSCAWNKKETFVTTKKKGMAGLWQNQYLRNI